MKISFDGRTKIRVLKDSDYQEVAQFILDFIQPNYQDMCVIVNSFGSGTGCDKKTIKNVLTYFLKNINAKNKEEAAQANIDELTDEIRELRKDILRAHKDQNLTHTDSEKLSSIETRMKNIEMELKAIHDRKTDVYESDYTKELSDIIDKIDVLDKKLEYTNDDIRNNKTLLRDIRDSKEGEGDNIGKILRSVNSILGTIGLLRDDINHIQVQPVSNNEEEEEEIKINNPDSQLLLEMYETSKKLNEMIFKAALCVNENDNKTLEQTDENIERVDETVKEQPESKEENTDENVIDDLKS